MIQKKRFSKWLLLAGIMSIALSVFFCPVASLPAQAAAPGEATVQPRKDDIRYRFTIIDNKMNITLRRSRLSGVARATIPDKQSHLVINYCIMF